MGLLRALFGLVRLLMLSALVAVLILFGFMYFDRNGEFVPKLRAAAETVVSPQVVTKVGISGADVSSELTDVVGTWLARAADLFRNGNASSARVAGSAPASEQAQQSHEILQLINDYRAQNGLHPLTWSDKLAAFGQSRADDMIARDYFSHHDPATGDMLLTRLHAFVTVGENLYQITGPAVAFMNDVSQQAFDGWRNSPSHNELMLDRRMDYAGVAIARQGTRIVVVLIASQ
jgi:uncharacterized protein YkwD